MKAFCILLFTVFSVSIKSQITFQKFLGNLGDDHMGIDLKKTRSGGYVLTGVTAQCWNFIVETDSIGNMLWTKTITSSGCLSSACVIQCNDKGYMITGHSQTANTGGQDLLLIKTDSVGNTVWSKTYGGPNNDYGYGIKQSSDGSYYVFGNTKSFGAGLSDFYLIKINSYGDTLWTKTYGGPSDDVGSYIVGTNDNGYILAGYTNSFGASGNDICLIRIDANGNILWTKIYGGVQNEKLARIIQTQDGGYIATGSADYLTNRATYLLKIDSLGNTKWSKIYNYTYNDEGKSIAQLQDGSYVVNGFNHGSFIIKTNPIGDTIWTRGYSSFNPIAINTLEISSDKGFIGLGSMLPTGPNAYSKVFLIKTDSLGWSGGCNYVNQIPTIDTISWSTITATPSISSGSIISPIVLQSHYALYMDNICTVYQIGVEEKKLKTNLVQIFPNPTKNSITISQTEPTFNKYEIYDLNGKLVSENKIQTILQKVDLSDYKEGMYIVKLIGTQKVEFKKIVVVE